MINKILIIFIVTFVIAIGILGYTLFNQRADTTNDTLLNNRFSSDNALNESDISGVSFEERERLVLNPPKDDASAKEQARHFLIAQSIAKEAPYLDITNCKKGEPVVFKAKEGEKFAVKNEDSVEHTISMGENQIFSIAAHSTKTILPEFKIGPGVYGYGCDASEKEVGMIFVTS